MMLKEKSNPWARLKYLYVLPLAAIAVTAFARPEISEKADEISAVKVNDLAAILEARSEENVVTASADTAKNKVVVVGVGTMPKDSSKEKTPLVIINGKESDRAVVDALDPSRIESISVLKNEDALKAYGEKAKDGAMIIQIKSTEVQMFSNKDVIGANVKMRLDALSSGDKNWGAKFYSATGGKPLVFIDGEEAIGEDPLSSISPDRIESVSVMKDKSAKEVYGDKGKNGVILVTLKTDIKSDLKQPAPIDLTDADFVKVFGSVKSEDGSLIIGASVLIAGTTNGTITDADGNFIIQAPEDGTIQISYADMQTEKVSVAPKVNVTLKAKKAQSDLVKMFGSVKGEDGSPVIGASVLIAGTTNGTITDADGNFIIQAPEDGTIQISYAGMQTEKISVAPKVNVTLKVK